MPALSRTQQKALVILIALAGSVGGYLMMYMSITRLHAEVDEQRVAQENAAAQKRNEQALEDLVAATAGDREELASHLLSTDDPTPFLSMVEALGSDAGVVLKVESIVHEDSTGAAKDAVKQPPAVRAMLAVTGSWDGIYHFVTLLEHMPYVTYIDSMAVEQKENDEGALVWRGQIGLRVLTTQ